MANTIKSKLKRMGSKRRSDAGEIESVDSPSSLKSKDSTSVRPVSESSEGDTPIQLKTPGNGPKSMDTSMDTSEETGSATAGAAITGTKSGTSSPAAVAAATVVTAGSPVGSTAGSAGTAGTAPKTAASTTPATNSTGATSLGSSGGNSSAPSSAPAKPVATPLAGASITGTNSKGERYDITTVAGKQYAVPKKHKTQFTAHTPAAARGSPHQSPLTSRSGSPAPGLRAQFLNDPKPDRLSRSSSRVALSRTTSLAQMAREHKLSLHGHSHSHTHTSTLSHGAPESRPSLSRNSSYADDRRVMEYIATKNSERNTENSNLMYRTSSRIWDATKESDMWFGYDTLNRSSTRRGSDASSDSQGEDENLHPGRYMSRTVSFDSQKEEHVPEFADSLIIRAADWLLGIPNDSPHTLRNTLKRKPKKMSLEDKRRQRETNIGSDPAFLMIAYMSIVDALK